MARAAHAQGLSFLKDAIEAEESARKQVAFDKYGQAVESFLLEIELEKRQGPARGSEERIAAARKLAQDCIERAEVLKSEIAIGSARVARVSLSPTAPPPSAPSTATTVSNVSPHVVNVPAPPRRLSPQPSASPSAPEPAPVQAFGALSMVDDDAMRADSKRRMLAGVVQILCGTGSGSGSVLTSNGYILTNHHVVGGSGDKPIFIAVNPPDCRSAPEIKYIAKCVVSDPELDLAMLQVIADYKRQHDPDVVINMETVLIGDSNTVDIGDSVYIVGFPGVGGSTVTLTRGIVSGFMENGKWIKTDAELNQGNSGGGAFKDGRLVAVASAATESNKGVQGKLGLLRPINMARSMVSTARAMSGRNIVMPGA